MKILGISAYYHDSAIAFIEDGKIAFAAQEERFSRKKNDSNFPTEAIKAGLKHTYWRLEDLDAIVFYDKPFLKFERLLETYLKNAPKGLRQFIKSMPVWLKQKLFIKKELKDSLSAIDKVNWSKTALLFSEHHLSHAASAFYPSGFSEAAILTIDGVGEYATASIAKGHQNKIEVLQELQFPDSLGLLYSAFTYFLGFKVNEGEYKVMGLAPYVNRDNEQYKAYYKQLKQHIIQIYDDGSIRLNQAYFAYQTSLKMVKTIKLEKLFGLKKRAPNEKLNENHIALAGALQAITEEVVIKMAEHAKQITKLDNVCLAGGVALNCVANGKLIEKAIFKDIIIQPAAGDSGGALGAALAAYYQHYEAKRNAAPKDSMQNGRLGQNYSSKEIKTILDRYKAEYKSYEENQLIEQVITWILDGKVIGWFQGRMEYGPRALGGRSILANPLDAEMQMTLNMKVKKRESFRPFAPIMLEEEFKRLFDQSYSSPYMLTVHKIIEAYRKTPPKLDGNIMQQVKQERSILPAITHIDYSSRIQTVKEENDKLMYKLLQKMKEKTGYGVLINTSFNLNKEPIVASPEDALNCFKKTDIDVLVLENCVVLK